MFRNLFRSLFSSLFGSLFSEVLKFVFVLSFFLGCFLHSSFGKGVLQIQLANIYNDNIDVSDYLISEKLDGIRAYWDGNNLISRQGNVFSAPDWFVKDFPKTHLEGELWISRGSFELASSIISKKIPEDKEWKKVYLMLFDMPKHQGSFLQRFEQMKKIVEKSQSKYLKVIDQQEISSQEELMKKLNKIVKNGGEGLMLHRKNSLYKATRNNDILKLKTFEDEEAKVISYIAGKGKYKGMMGSILVENKAGIRFKIGGGFSDEERKNPPKIGSIITYKFYGKTKNNKPRFASFIRVRNEF
jgi:DNA ligase-1